MWRYGLNPNHHRVNDLIYSIYTYVCSASNTYAKVMQYEYADEQLSLQPAHQNSKFAMKFMVLNDGSFVRV